MKLPNFLVIGAAKCGTTSLHHYLSDHPEIFICPVNEPNYFAYCNRERLDFSEAGNSESIAPNSITDFESYSTLFSEADGFPAVGEVSPLYLYHNSAPKNIFEKLGLIKFIVILRNPVDRAFSQSQEREHKNQGWGWNYKDVGFYGTQLQRYFDLFPKDSFFIRLFDEFQKQPQKILRELCEFLEIDATYQFHTSIKHNISGIPKNKWLHDFLRTKNTLKSTIKTFVPNSLRRNLWHFANQKNLSKPSLDPETRKRIASFYVDDILRLQEMIGRDLSHWLPNDDQYHTAYSKHTSQTSFDTGIHQQSH